MTPWTDSGKPWPSRKWINPLAPVSGRAPSPPLWGGAGACPEAGKKETMGFDKDWGETHSASDRLLYEGDFWLTERLSIYSARDRAVMGRIGKPIRPDMRNRPQYLFETGNSLSYIEAETGVLAAEIETAVATGHWPRCRGCYRSGKCSCRG